MPSQPFLSRRALLRASVYGMLLAGCRPAAQIAATLTPTVRPSVTATGRPTRTPIPTRTPMPTSTPSPTPWAGPTVSDSPIVQVAAGPLHSLALRADGKVCGWGDAGILGMPRHSGDYILTPSVIEGVEQVDAIFAALYTLMIQAGKLLAMGFYDTGTVALLENIDHVVQATGDSWYILALRADGTVWGLGDNGGGQLGDGSTASTDHFVQTAIDGVVHIATDGGSVVAVREDGTVWHWGAPITYVSDQPALTPQPIPNLTNVAQVAFADGLAALHRNGAVSVLWYDDSIRALPVSQKIIQVDGSRDYFGYALADDGTLWAWGVPWEELGIGPTPFPSPGYGNLNEEQRLTPRQVAIHNVVNVSADYEHTIALDGEGTVWVWGCGGALGAGKFVGQPEIELLPIPIIRSTERP